MIAVAQRSPMPIAEDDGNRGYRVFWPTPAAVSSERLLRMQRYRDLRRVRPAIRAAADQAVRQAVVLQRPAVVYRWLAIEHCAAGELALRGGARFHCAAFDRLLAGSKEVAVFALTVGNEIDRTVIGQSERGELLEALLLETAAWLCVEEATRQFKRWLRAEAAARGWFLTRRLGPGYSYNDAAGGRCMWALDEQATLFDAIGQPVDAPLVRLMQSNAMLPKMSRSGLFGLTTVAPASAGSDDQ